MSEEENINQSFGDSLPLPENESENADLPEMIEASEPSSIINEPLTIMEVHKHPHHVTHKKKWGEYLLEFFMLFLAVFLGFVAENYREDIVEGKKEKEVVKALFNELKKDTANLNDIIYRYIPEHSAWEDSAELYITSLTIKGNEKIIAKALINATNWNQYYPSQVTLELLKSSGTFNLIKSQKVKAGIVNFNQLVNIYLRYSQFTLDVEHKLDTATAGIIKRDALRILIDNSFKKTNAIYGSITDQDIPDNIQFKTYDKNVFIDFISKIDAVDYLLHDLLQLYRKILKEEVLMLDILNGEYHLENE